jgi:acyl carrier protein
MRIETEFGFRPPESEWDRLLFNGTVGEFVDQLIANDRNG